MDAHGTRLACVGLAILGAACASPPPPVEPGPDPMRNARIERLSDSVHRIAKSAWNPGRMSAARAHAAEQGLAGHGRSEWIDWFSVQQNHVIEIPGSGEGIAYLVAHVDKTDMNPLKYASVLVNGMLDEVVGFANFGQGAWDNATGTALALEVARALRDANPRLTWRVLLVGSEESGLRGSRAHVARLSQSEWQRMRFAINVDTVAKDDSPNCVIENASDEGLMAAALDHAAATGLPLTRGEMPAGASGDHVPFSKTDFWHDFGRGLMFNMPGGLLPQRSWFTRGGSTRVLTFASCDILDWSDYLGGFLILPTGRLHGPRDRTSRVDLEKLADLVELIEGLALELDAQG